MEMLRTRQKVQTALETAARDLSQYGYILYRLDQGDEGVLEQKEDWIDQLPDFLAGLSVKAYLREKIADLVGEEKLEKLVISQAELMEDGENIKLTAEYSLKLPFSILRIQGIPAVSQTVRRAWIGSRGDRGGEVESEEGVEEMVYIGSSMEDITIKNLSLSYNDFKAVPMIQWRIFAAIREESTTPAASAAAGKMGELFILCLMVPATTPEWTVRL